MEKKMLLQDLSESIATKENITKKRADLFVKTMFEIIEKGLSEDNFVKVKGFGTFKLVEVSERESIDVNTGERIQISGHSKISFTPDTNLKDLINRPFAHFQTVILNESTSIEELEQINSLEGNESTLENSEDTPKIDNTPKEPVQESHNENNTNLSNPKEVDVTVSINDTDNLNIEDNNRLEESKINNICSIEDKGHDNHTDTLKSASLTDEKAIKTVEPKEEPETLICLAEPKESVSTEIQEEDNSNHISEYNSKPDERITYVVREKEHKVWILIAYIILSILLMVLSYIAGYFRVFCPTDTTQSKQIIESQTPTKIGQTLTDTTLHDGLADSLSQNIDKGTDLVINDENTPSCSSNKIDSATKAINTEKSTVYNQIKDGKYLIVGTLKTHKVNPGETIRTIALDVYGSKGYAPYIIIHNNLSDPNNIEVGTQLKLPVLRLAK